MDHMAAHYTSEKQNPNYLAYIIDFLRRTDYNILDTHQIRDIKILPHSKLSFWYADKLFTCPYQTLEEGDIIVANPRESFAIDTVVFSVRKDVTRLTASLANRQDGFMNLFMPC